MSVARNRHKLPPVRPFDRRTLYIIGSIDHASYLDFTRELARLEQSATGPIAVELCSDGGDAAVSLAFYSRIRSSPCDIHIKGIGQVNSAAVLILAAGDRRTMTEETWLMVHEESAELSGYVHDLKREVAQLQQVESQCNRLLSLNSNMSEEEWAAMHKQTTYLSADDCLAIKLIHEVL